AESAAPRASATSRGSSPGPGEGTRAVLPDAGATSDANTTSTSGSCAIARDAPASARRKRSIFSATGASLAGLPDHALRKILAEHPLIIFGDQRPFGFIALVQEADPERVADVSENVRVLRPADHGARAHDRRNVAV